MESTQPPSDLAEREEVKAQIIDLLKQVDVLEARLAELNAMPDKPQPEADKPKS